MLNATTTVSEAYKSPAALLNLIVTNVFIASGFVIMGMIMVAGFQALSGSSKGLEQAKKTALNTLIGFLVMFAAYWLIQILKAVTGAEIDI
jgi:hypothetical protein